MYLLKPACRSHQENDYLYRRLILQLAGGIEKFLLEVAVPSARNGEIKVVVDDWFKKKDPLQVERLAGDCLFLKVYAKCGIQIVSSRLI